MRLRGDHFLPFARRRAAVPPPSAACSRSCVLTVNPELHSSSECRRAATRETYRMTQGRGRPSQPCGYRQNKAQPMPPTVEQQHPPGRLPDRHRPGHDQQRPGLRRSASDRTGRTGPTSSPFPCRNWSPPAKSGTAPLLPSFLYLPGQHDLPPGATALPWDAHRRRRVVGEFARNHGCASPADSSPLPSPGCVMPASIAPPPLLPWSAPPDVPRISPVEASDGLLAAPRRWLELRHGRRTGRKTGWKNKRWC